MRAYETELGVCTNVGQELRTASTEWGGGGGVRQIDVQVEWDVHFEQMHLQNHSLYALYDSALAVIISYQFRDTITI